MAAVSLTVIIPMHNEQRTIESLLHRLLSVELPCLHRVHVVDDASEDASVEAVLPLVRTGCPAVQLTRLSENVGKGGAIIAAIASVDTTHVAVLDADLELAPEDLPRVMSPIVSGHADGVIGVRSSGLVMPGAARAVAPLRYRLANRVITTTFNAAHGTRLLDVMSGYKVLPTEIFRSCLVTHRGFAIEIDLAAAAVTSGMRLSQVPVAYAPRGKQQGKKIRATDSLSVMSAIAYSRWGRHAS